MNTKVNTQKKPPQNAHRETAVCWCDGHGFQLSTLTQIRDDKYIFTGQCGCEIIYSGFYVETAPGKFQEVKPHLQKTSTE
jgi:hypothetical protein